MSQPVIQIKFKEKTIKKNIEGITFEGLIESISRSCKTQIRIIVSMDQKILTSLDQIRQVLSNGIKQFIAYEQQPTLIKEVQKSLQESSRHHQLNVDERQLKKEIKEASSQESTSLERIKRKDINQNNKYVCCDGCQGPIYCNELVLINIKGGQKNEKLCIECGNKQEKHHFFSAIRCQNFMKEIEDVEGIIKSVIVTRNNTISSSGKQQIFNGKKQMSQDFHQFSNKRINSLQQKIETRCIKLCNFDRKNHSKSIVKINQEIRKLEPQLKNVEINDAQIDKYAKRVQQVIEK